MPDALVWHRFQFAFTVSFHYLFPQLTMGLALLIVIFKALALKTGNQRYHDTARFWGKVFGLGFAVGVVTGIPLEFQFGTNWAKFSTATGGVIGQTLAMEAVFAFFLESTFLGLFLYGEKKLGPRGHFAAAVALLAGSWLSGYFIIVTNAFMQHPVGYTLDDGVFRLAGFWTYLLNPWALWQYAHNMTASVITASFAVAAVGAYWTLMKIHAEPARLCLRVAVITGLIACILIIYPTGDGQGKLVAQNQPATLAAMEGLFKSGANADLAIIGQPNVAEHKLENPIYVPGALSFLAYGTFGSTVKGLDDVPADQWPDNIELLYYAYHIMAGLGTIFILIMLRAAWLLWRRRLDRSPATLWLLMLAVPFPFIANTVGWWTAELGRQPWTVYGYLRTAAGGSPTVHAGNVVFTLLGFVGLYILLGLLFVYLVIREIAHGPGMTNHNPPSTLDAQPRTPKT